MSEAAVSHYLAEYDRFRDTLATPWLAQPRAAALDFLRTNGFPSRRTEQWKYTDVTPITRKKFTAGRSAPADIDATLVDNLRFSQLDCHELVFINGSFSAALSRNEPLPDGMTAQSLQSVGTDDALLLDTYLSNGQIKNAFNALNTAFFNDGVLVHVPDNTEVATPIHIIYVTGVAGETLMSNPRNLIVLGRNSGASVIESFAGTPDTEYFSNSHTSILGKAGSRLDYYRIQQESRRAYHIGNTRIRQEADSRIDCHTLSLGGKLARCDIDVELDEPGAEVNLNGLYLTNNRQHIDNHTLIEHKQPHTVSNEHFRGIMNGHSRAVFNGKVIVHEQAQKTEAHQSNANLLLSGDAEVDTKPELEIYADDVKCSHGATVGRLDENMLFYLRSRAVDQDTARSLLTYAFADEVIRDIKFPEIRERLEHSIAGELPDTDLIEEFMQ